LALRTGQGSFIVPEYRCANCGKWEPRPSGERPNSTCSCGNFVRGDKASKKPDLHNDHPTCKPVALFGWLLALGCPRVTPDGKRPVMLDPFFGSGSSGVAAIRLGIDYIGIDSDEHYCEIAEARTAFAKEEQALAKSEQKQHRLEL